MERARAQCGMKQTYKRNERMGNSWDGFDSNAMQYSEKEDRRYNARIWWVLFVVGFGVFISLFVRVICDNITAGNSKVIVGEYQVINGKKVVAFENDEGYKRYLGTDGTAIKEKAGKPLMFKAEGEREYHTLTAAGAWIPFFIFFGGMSGVCGYKLVKIYKKKKYE